MVRPRLSLTPLALTALLATASPLLAQEPPPAPPSRIEVDGEGTVYRAPDLAVTQLTVMRNAPTAAEALADVNKAIGDVSSAMSEFGVEKRDLRTAGFQISPQYQYDNRQDGPQAPPKLVGYEVRNTLSVKVRDLTKLGALLDKAVTLGVNEGGSIQFEIDNPTEATQEARRLAVADAKARAETLAEASGLKLGRVLLIQDGAIRREPSPPMPFAEMKLAAAPPSPRVPVEIGENAVRADIRIVYEMRN
ncbi:SIMPL domain-containing protein [Aureimonas sp. N4]|uniref:SIMPL domain-containing protein n=1 Tax=Aureimonas sp. N4 TaxID=1638165 RepID=UPI000A5D3C61|nr:SIMPL domain-containing protein [Aureimonas sp. N4]